MATFLNKANTVVQFTAADNTVTVCKQFVAYNASVNADEYNAHVGMHAKMLTADASVFNKCIDKFISAGGQKFLPNKINAMGQLIKPSFVGGSSSTVYCFMGFYKNLQESMQTKAFKQRRTGNTNAACQLLDLLAVLTNANLAFVGLKLRHLGWNEMHHQVVLLSLNGLIDVSEPRLYGQIVSPRNSHTPQPRMDTFSNLFQPDSKLNNAQKKNVLFLLHSFQFVALVVIILSAEDTNNPAHQRWLEQAMLRANKLKRVFAYYSAQYLL